MSDSRTKDLAAALKNAVLEPQNIESLFKTLAGSKVVFGGFGNKAAEQPALDGGQGNGAEDEPKSADSGWLYLMCFKDTPDDGVGETTEYVPFFHSLTHAKRLLKKMKLPLDAVSLREAPVQDFFHLVTEMNKEARLNPGDKYTWAFSSEDMYKIMRLSLVPSEKKPSSLKLLQEESARRTAAKIELFRPTGDLPATMAKVVELAEHCFDDCLLFHPGLKTDSELRPELNSPAVINQVWRMFLALAQVLHIMHFRQRNFTRPAFIKETGLAIILPAQSAELPTDPEINLFVTDLLKRDLSLRFSVLNEEKKLLIHGFDTETLFPVSFDDSLKAAG